MNDAANETGFDFEAYDRQLQAKLRGEEIPSPLDTYDRAHSMSIIIEAALQAATRLSNYEPASRRVSANYDVPKSVDRKLASAMKALNALLDAARDEREAAR